MPLSDVMKRADWAPVVDVLQVDCEGFDDEVLYHSSLAELTPKLINFEETALTTEQIERLSRALRGLGYSLQSTGQDVLAIRDAI